MNKLFINTGFNSQIQGNELIINLQTPFKINKLWKNVCLTYFSIPSSFFYTIPENDNTFILFENLINKDVLLTPGYYSSSSLIAHLQTQLNTTSNSYNVFTVTLQSDNKIKIVGQLNFVIDMSSTKILYKILGISNKITSSATTTIFSKSINLFLPYSILLYIYPFHSSTNINVLKDIHFIIPFSEDSESLTKYYNNNQFDQILNIKKDLTVIDQLRIKLYRSDTMDEVLNFNYDFEFLLTFFE
jgi:hypothetical protein